MSKRGADALTAPPSPPRFLPGGFPAAQRPHPEPSSFFTTIRRFFPIAALHNLAQRFWRPQRIRVDSITREDGARKKRLVDMGAGDVTPTNPRASPARRARQSHPWYSMPVTPLKMPGAWLFTPQLPSGFFTPTPLPDPDTPVAAYNSPHAPVYDPMDFDDPMDVDNDTSPIGDIGTPSSSRRSVQANESSTDSLGSLRAPALFSHPATLPSLGEPSSASVALSPFQSIQSSPHTGGVSIATKASPTTIPAIEGIRAVANEAHNASHSAYMSTTSRTSKASGLSPGSVSELGMPDCASTPTRVFQAPEQVSPLARIFYRPRLISAGAPSPPVAPLPDVVKPSVTPSVTPPTFTRSLHSAPVQEDFPLSEPDSPNLFGPNWFSNGTDEINPKPRATDAALQTQHATESPTPNQKDSTDHEEESTVDASAAPIKEHGSRHDGDLLSPRQRGRPSTYGQSTTQRLPPSVVMRRLDALGIRMKKAGETSRKNKDAFRAGEVARAKARAQRRAEVRSILEEPPIIEEPPKSEEPPRTEEHSKDAVVDQAIASHNPTLFEYENDLSTLSDAPTPPPRKTARFALKDRVKTFYRDSMVADLQDSFLEDIKTCSDPKSARALLQLPVDLDQQGSPLKNESSFAPSSAASSAASSSDSESVGFRGVPQDIWDEEDSIEESSFSTELADELYQEVEQKLLITPPPVAPAPVASKPLISGLGTDELAILEKAAKATDYGKNRSVHVIEHKLSVHDFSTLLPKMFSGDPKAWLNDQIVNEYLAILVEHQKKKEGYEHKKGGPAPPVHAFLSQWYNNMKTNPSSVARWASRKQLDGANFLDARLVLFPIVDNYHWRLLAIKPQDRAIEVYDSLGNVGETYMETALAYLQMELGNDFVATEWTVSTQQKSVGQENSSDCGVFTVLNALVLLRGEEQKRVVSIKWMEDARRRMAVTLLTGQVTGELD